VHLDRAGEDLPGAGIGTRHEPGKSDRSRLVADHLGLSCGHTCGDSEDGNGKKQENAFHCHFLSCGPMARIGVVVMVLL
jgi:hypothetical protein